LTKDVVGSDTHVKGIDVGAPVEDFFPQAGIGEAFGILVVRELVGLVVPAFSFPLVLDAPLRLGRNRCFESSLPLSLGLVLGDGDVDFRPAVIYQNSERGRMERTFVRPLRCKRMRGYNKSSLPLCVRSTSATKCMSTDLDLLNVELGGGIPTRVGWISIRSRV
jgi:hypothetical protein